MKAIFSPRMLLSAVVLTLGVAATAFAVAPEGNRCGRDGRAGGRMEQGMGQGMAYGMQEMSRLHGDLKLDSRQEALWQAAEQAGRDSMGGMRGQTGKQREAALAMLDQPGADLRAVIRQMDETRDAGRKEYEANRERWLAVYDSLNPEQKEKARLFFKSRLGRMAHQHGSGRGGPGRE